MNTRDEIREEVERQLRERDAARRNRRAIGLALLLALFGANLARAQQGVLGGTHQMSDLFRRFFTWSGADITVANEGTFSVAASGPGVTMTLNPGVDSNFLYVQGAPLRVTSSAGGFGIYNETGSFTSAAGSGSNAFGVVTNGARVDFGAGASDYASSDGTTVTFAGPITATGTTGLNLATASARLSWTSSGRYIASNEATGDLQLVSFGLALGNNRFIGAAAPTIGSGFGTSPAVAAANGTAAFRITVGNPTGASGVITLPTATTGWRCSCDDITTQSATVFLTKQTATSTTSCTIGNFDAAGASQNWVAGDGIVCSAMAY